MLRSSSTRKHNVLLVKDDVGKAKPNTRRMPPNEFIFGKPERRDPEDAQAGKYYFINLNRDVTDFSFYILGLSQNQFTETSRQRFLEA